MKTINALAKHIAKLEGKKSQARIGDIKEILSLLSDLVFQDRYNFTNKHLYGVIFRNGERRAKRKKK